MPTKKTIQRIALVAIGALVLSAGAADAAGRIGPGQIRNNAIHTRHIANGAVTNPKIRNGAVGLAKLAVGAVGTHRIRNGAVTSAKIQNGTIRPVDLSPAVRQALQTTFAGANWGIVDRNVQGNGDSYLRAGPSMNAFGVSTKPPYGIGSLGMRVSGPGDKASFGNQTDFAGNPISGINTLSYWVFTPTGGVSPNLQFEANPHAFGSTFTTLSFENPGVTPSTWTKLDATTAHWGMSGAAGANTGCTLTSPCDWNTVKQDLPNATIISYLFNIGSGAQALSAAVDGLQVNNTAYDFEPFGVSAVAPH